MTSLTLSALQGDSKGRLHSYRHRYGRQIPQCPPFSYSRAVPPFPPQHLRHIDDHERAALGGHWKRKRQRPTVEALHL